MNIPIIMENLLQEPAITLYILCKTIQNKFQLKATDLLSTCERILNNNSDNYEEDNFVSSLE